MTFQKMPSFERARLVDSKDTGLVAVERQRLTKTLEVLTGRLKVRKRRLSPTESHDHQAASRIVDIDKRCARRSTVLEPSVVTAVDLN